MGKILVPGSLSCWRKSVPEIVWGHYFLWHDLCHLCFSGVHCPIIYISPLLSTHSVVVQTSLLAIAWTCSVHVHSYPFLVIFVIWLFCSNFYYLWCWSNHFFFFKKTVSLYCPCWPRTLYIDPSTCFCLQSTGLMLLNARWQSIIFTEQVIRWCSAPTDTFTIQL